MFQKQNTQVLTSKEFPHFRHCTTADTQAKPQVIILAYSSHPGHFSHFLPILARFWNPPLLSRAHRHHSPGSLWLLSSSLCYFKSFPLQSFFMASQKSLLKTQLRSCLAPFVMQQHLPAASRVNPQVLILAARCSNLASVLLLSRLGTLSTYFPFFHLGLFVLQRVKRIPASESLIFCPLF